MEIHERIKHLRKDKLHMTQDDFAPKIDISRSNLGNIEIGRIAVTERVISAICREFNVSEKWLRTGEGEIFEEVARSEIIARFAGELMKEENDSFRRRLFELLAQLDEQGWETLERLAKKLTKKID